MRLYKLKLILYAFLYEDSLYVFILVDLIM